jgi:FSR family fosmidomycin resistance protein-like MFS transporter
MLRPAHTPSTFAALAPLLLLALVHVILDAFALFLQPLWPDLQEKLSLSDGTTQTTFFLWNVATSIPQVAFGMWGDRFHARWLLWAGPAMAMACVSSVGLVDSYWALNALLTIGGLGVAAFHPEAAALAGNLFPENRGRALAIFSVGGYIGQAIGPYYSGRINEAFSMSALAWSIPVGLLSLLIYVPILRHSPIAQTTPTTERVSLGKLTSGRKLGVLLLVVIGILRVMPVLGVPLSLAYGIKSTGGGTDEIGLVQTWYFVGIGLGGLWSATRLRRQHERLVLSLLPLFSVPPLFMCPQLHDASLLACVAIAGMFLGAALPVLVSYGQQLLPEGQRFASSLTMGVTWGLASAVVAVTMAVANHAGVPEQAIYLFAAGAVVSSGLCVWLPRLH